MKKILLLTTLIFSLYSYSQSPDYEWIKSFGSSDDDAGLFITQRDGGDLFLAGRFSDTLQLGSTELISRGGNDAFITKFDSLGNLLWVEKLGGTTGDEGKAIAFDSEGNIYFAGKFHSPVAQIGDTVLLSCGCSEFTFISKFSNDGAFLWARGIEGDGAVILENMSVNSADEIVISGTFYNSAFFETGTQYSSGSSDIFIAKYNTDGDEILVKKLGGPDTDLSHGMEILENDSILLTGKFKTEIDFGTGTIESLGINDIFLVKLDANGNTGWVKTFGGLGDDVPFDVTTDNTGSIIISGYFTDTAFFEDQEIISNGFYDVFIAKFNSNGSISWIRSYGNNFDEQGNSIATDINNNIYLTGKYSLDFSFGSSILPGNTYSDVFILKWDESGNELWAKMIAGYRNDEGLHLFNTDNNEFYITGYFRDSAYFDSYFIEGDYGNDIFMAKLSPEGGMLSPMHSNNGPHILIYPNPVKDYFYIECQEPITRLQLFNSHGQLILNKQSANTKSEKIITANLPTGIYWLQINNNQSRKIVKVN